MKRAIVLLSGGIDSATTLAAAKAEGYDLYALSFDYGQRHIIEINSARKQAVKAGVRKFLLMDIHLRHIGGSALTSDIDVPKGRLSIEELTAQSPPRTEGEVPITYVPARNTIFLSVALAWAESIGSSDIFIGVNAVDYSGYPDCRPEFLKAFETLANLATKASVSGNVSYRIHAPLIMLSKSEIIRKAIALNVDLSETWSCYDPQDNGPCLRCDSCILREKGFREAGIEDPLIRCS